MKCEDPNSTTKCSHSVYPKYLSVIWLQYACTDHFLFFCEPGSWNTTSHMLHIWLDHNGTHFTTGPLRPCLLPRRPVCNSTCGHPGKILGLLGACVLHPAQYQKYLRRRTLTSSSSILEELSPCVSGLLLLLTLLDIESCEVLGFSTSKKSHIYK